MLLSIGWHSLLQLYNTRDRENIFFLYCFVKTRDKTEVRVKDKIEHDNGTFL